MRIDLKPAVPAYDGVTSGPPFEAARRAMNRRVRTGPVTLREGGMISALPADDRYHRRTSTTVGGQACGGVLAFAKLFEDIARR